MAISLLAVVPRAAYAQSAEAERRFVEAEALLSAGKVEEACDAFQDSNRLEPSAGTLINIGLCKEKLGKLASALAAYQAALERVKDPKKKAIAKDREAALRPRVSRLVISVAPEAQVQGLIVSRDGQQIDAADFGRRIPLDGGSYEIVAKAPGYRRWSTSIKLKAEGDELLVKVPVLVQGKTESALPASSAGSDEEQGKVVVNGNVKSGDVFIGADKKGRLEDGTITLTLPDGTHELAVEAPGHKRYEATITVKSGRTRTVTAELEEIVGDPPKAGGGSSRTALKVSGIGLAAVSVATGGYWIYLTVAGPERAYDDAVTPDANGISPKLVQPDGQPYPNKPDGSALGGPGDCDIPEAKEARTVDADLNKKFDAACKANKLRWTVGPIAMVSGVAAGVLLYFAFRDSGGPKEGESGAVRKRRQLSVTPVISPSGGGAMVSFDW